MKVYSYILTEDWYSRRVWTFLAAGDSYTEPTWHYKTYPEALKAALHAEKTGSYPKSINNMEN